MKIEVAHVNDIPQINKLYEILFLAMAKLQQDYFQAAKQDEEFIKSIIDSDDHDILIAKENNQIIGFALVQKLTTPPYHCFVFHRYAYLMDLVVDPAHRGQGVGKALLQEVKDWARVRELEYVELNVLTQNKKAIAMYEKTGYVECNKVMRLKIE